MRSILGLLGAVLAFPATIALQLFLFTGTLLHLFTTYVAFKAVGFLIAGVVLLFPVLGEIGVALYSWHTSGALLNGYTVWLFMWLGILLVLLALMGVGIWLAHLAAG